MTSEGRLFFFAYQVVSEVTNQFYTIEGDVTSDCFDGAKAAVTTLANETCLNMHTRMVVAGICITEPCLLVD